jgi:hypothetical protein
MPKPTEPMVRWNCYLTPEQREYLEALAAALSRIA